MTREQQLEIKLARLSGEFVGTLEAMLFWNIPVELKEKISKQVDVIKEEYYGEEVIGTEAN